MQKLALITALCALVGCSMTLGVEGKVQATGEIFTGKATGYLDSAGDMQLVSNKGARCDGTFVYINRRQGSGTFVCDDGRSGSFDFVSTGMRGTGVGEIDGHKFTFVFR